MDFAEHETRSAAQVSMLSRLIPGDIVAGSVCLVERDAVWADLGGIRPACLPAERIALSPGGAQTARFARGQGICAAVLSVHRESRTIFVTHYELLGTFAENAARLAPGQRVTGHWLSPRQIEITPNLWGEVTGPVSPAVYEKGGAVETEILTLDAQRAFLTLRPIRRAVGAARPPFHYYQTEGRLRRWTYLAAEPARYGPESVFMLRPLGHVRG